jgi:hypothetical protein
MPHEIHVSERRSFRGCRRRWDWAYREGYRPHAPAKPLEFGIAFHMGFEAFYDPHTWKTTTVDQKLHNAIQVFESECEKQKESYLKREDLSRMDDEVALDYAERIDRGQGMLRYHAAHVHRKYDTWFKPIATELSFEVPIVDPDDPSGKRLLRCHNSPSCGQNHSNNASDSDSQVVYAGRVDMLVEDIRYGGYFIWDHKTAAQLASDDGFLQLDDQVASYCWALSLQLGLNVKGFIYAETRKDYPRTPQPLKRAYKGCNFSTSKTQPTTLEVYRKFVERRDSEAFKAGNYNGYLEFLASDEATKFHQRFVVTKTERELQEIGRNISLEAADMVSSNLRVYPSVGRFTCSSCAFREPCINTFLGEDTDYALSSNYEKTPQRYYHTAPINSDKVNK